MMAQLYEETLAQSDPDSCDCLLFEEKIIYTSIIYYEDPASQAELN